VLVLAWLIHIAFDHGNRMGWMFGSSLGSEAQEIVKIAAVQRALECGKGGGENSRQRQPTIRVGWLSGQRQSFDGGG
jgi:hypothetical protein